MPWRRGWPRPAPRCVSSAYGDRAYNWAYRGCSWSCRSSVARRHRRHPGLERRLPTRRQLRRRSIRHSHTRRRHEPGRSRAHPAVEPAESPLTPESWGKLGMWIFLAGDAVGFGVLLAAYGAMRATSADWPEPVRGPRHQPHRPDDVPADLLERHDGQGARVARQGRPGAGQEFLFSRRSAARSSWASRPTSGRT